MLVRRTVKFSVFAVVLLALGFFTLFSASLYTFHVLTAETLIAELEFERLGDDHYLAKLQTGDGCEERELELYGDQWRIDAEFVKWKYWATLLGLDSQYRLDRLEGRYTSAVDQNTSRTLAHDLNTHTTIDIVDISNSLGPLNFLVDATYGSSTYQSVDPARIYRVYRTQTGLLTRNEPLPLRAPGQGLAVEVRRGCGGEPGAWQRFSEWTDRTLADAL